MKKHFARNLILRTLTYTFIICALPYCYFLWHAKQGVDAFLVTRNYDAKLDYSWLWINQEGEIYLEDVRIFKKRKSPIIKVPRLKISLPSIFDLLDSREQVVYKTYPNQIRVSVMGAITDQPETSLNLFGIHYKPKHLNLIFPNNCNIETEIQLPKLEFDLSVSFKIQQTADISLVEFKFKDSQFATIKGSFNINQLFETGANTTYLSDLVINLDDLTWFQKNSQNCLEKLKLSRNKLTIFYSNFLGQNALDNQLILNKEATRKISDFFYQPETIDINLDIKEGITYSQIKFDPVYDFQERVGLSIDLNRKNIGSIFSDKVGVNIEEKDNNGNNISQPNQTSQPNSDNENQLISKNKQSLSKYLGSKIKLNLYNGRPHTGYLESIGRDQLSIKKLEYKGKSTLPFEYSQIKSIQLLVIAN